MLSKEQPNPTNQDIIRPTVDLFEGLSTQEVMSDCDVEERIYGWLESRGIRPESPSMKRYAYFERRRTKTLLKLSGWGDDIELSDTKPLNKKTISVSTIAEDRLPHSNKSDLESFSCQGSSLLSRRGFKAVNIRVESEWSPISVSGRLDNTGVERETIDSKMTKSTLLSRRKLLNIEPLNISSVCKNKSGESSSFTVIDGEENASEYIDLQMFNSAKGPKPPKCIIEDDLETRGRLATVGSIANITDYQGSIR